MNIGLTGGLECKDTDDLNFTSGTLDGKSTLIFRGCLLTFDSHTQIINHNKSNKSN